MEELSKKVYTEEDIRRLAPGYRGKPENFDPAKVEKKGPTASPQPKVVGPKQATLPPSNIQTK
jgi:hypothetical protein